MKKSFVVTLQKLGACKHITVEAEDCRDAEWKAAVRNPGWMATDARYAAAHHVIGKDALASQQPLRYGLLDSMMRDV